MTLVNRMIEGVKNWANRDRESSIDVVVIHLEQPAQRPGWSKPYASREDAIAAAKTEIDAKLKSN
jgi:hypothetical protein